MTWRDLREAGHTWSEIASLLGYGSPQHAFNDHKRRIKCSA
jgi:AraC-like DNA-binding protein